MRSPNTTALALLCGAMLASTPSMTAGPRFASGDVTFSGTVQVSETSRVAPQAGSSSDVIYGFIPTVIYTRESNRLDLSATVSAPIQRYDSNDHLDSNTLSANLSGEVPFGAGPRLTGSWNLSYFDGIQANYLTNRNLDSKTFDAGISADYVLRNRLSLRSRLGYSDRSSNGIESAFSNSNHSTQFALGLHAHELIRGRVGLYTEYVIRERKTDFGTIGQGVDDSDDGINFGITGQILPERLFPKLEADLSFGFSSTEGTDRSNVDAGRQDRLIFNGSLRYPANPKTNVALLFSRGISITDDDRSVESERIQLAIDYTPRQKLSFTAGIGLEKNDFLYDIDRRQDDVVNFNIAASYAIRQSWNAQLSYQLRDSSSNQAISDYDSSLVTLSTTLRY